MKRSFPGAAAALARRRWVRVSAGALLALPVAAEAQQPPENLLQQQRLIDERLRAEREELAPLASRVDWQWGGWFDYYVFHFDDGVQGQRVLQRPSLFLWTRLSADQGTHEAFARMRLSYSYYNPGDEFDRQEDWEGPNLDRGWYQLDVMKLLKADEPGAELKVRVGRQDVMFGTGYAFDQPLDAVAIEGRIADLRISSLLGRTIGSYPNIDRSEPVDTHSARNIYGVQLTYEGIDRHRPFAYAIFNDDYTDERPKDYRQDYSYDTQYFGIGSRGELAHNLNYWLEGVYESGRSFGDGNFVTRDYVNAWAIDVGVEKLWDLRSRPRVVGEYMFASGDPDRLFSPTNAAGGNRGDREDNSFVGFGYRDTGISLGPTLSNLHIWKLGGSLYPLHAVEFLRDVEIGSNWFLFHKNHRRAAISDSTAGEFAGYVGWEMDYFINWRLGPDLSWTIRWGAFFPGDAYSDKDMRNFVFTGVTWSF